jgi:hypothetical protein
MDTTIAGLTAPLIANRSLASPVRGNEADRHIERKSGNAHRQVVRRHRLRVASNGDHQVSGDTLDAVIAGVNIVEDDPRDNSVGYGGLPNEDGESNSILVSCRPLDEPARSPACAISNPSRSLASFWSAPITSIVGDGAQVRSREGFKKEDLD